MSREAVNRKAKYKTLTVEAALTGWIVREQGQPPEVFHRWGSVVAKLEKELTTGVESLRSNQA